VKLTRQRAVLVALAALVLSVALVWAASPRALLVADFDRQITDGMSRTDIIAILGPPDIEVGKLTIWELGDGNAGAIFDGAGHATDTFSYPWSPWELMVDRLRRRTGL
jgi:hypothetical protein